MKSRKGQKNKIELPSNFQEVVKCNEIKYEQGERTSHLLKEMISLYKVFLYINKECDRILR